MTRLVETDSIPKHHISGFGDVSFLRSELEPLLDSVASSHAAPKKRGPKPKYDPEVILRILEVEDDPKGSASQGELARALVDHPNFKKLGLTEPYAEKLVRRYRDT